MMTEIAFYLHKETGQFLGPADVRRKVSQFHTDAEGKTRKDFAPRDPTRWSESALAQHGIYPVYATDSPEVDDRLQIKDGRGAVWDEDRYVQAWNVIDKFADMGELKSHLLNELDGIANRRRNAGITVDGVPVRTDQIGLARITGAKMSGRSERKFPTGGGDYVTLSSADIDGIFEAVDSYIEQVDNRQVELIEAIKASDDPINIDLEAGWPG